MLASIPVREQIDQLIARKAQRYVEVAAQGLRFFPAGSRDIRSGCRSMAGSNLLRSSAPGDRIRTAAA